MNVAAKEMKRDGTQPIASPGQGAAGSRSYMKVYRNEVAVRRTKTDGAGHIQSEPLVRMSEEE